MKSFIKTITIIVVFNLLLACSATAQTAPATVGRQVVSTVDDTLARVRDRLIQLKIDTTGQFDDGGILVIPTAEIKPQDLVTLMEDMTIMCRIFDKKSTQLYPTTGRFRSNLGFSMPFSRDSRSIKAMYVQGYGALFLTKVDFPLSPPPKEQEEKETEEEDADPLWTQMRQEIYAPEEVGRGRRTDDRPEEKYDAEKVENLKTTLIKALKHAANIRNLKPDESVVLTVIGKAGQPAVSAIERLYEEDYSRYIVSTRAGTGFSSPTVLTIRAKKVDIDAFAKDQLSFDQFRQKTLLLSYSYLGENVGGPSRSSLTNVIYGGRSRIRRR